MKRKLFGAAMLASLALATPAGAQPPAGPETITTSLSFPSFPTAPPYVGTYSGTFTAAGAVADAGTVNVQARFAAVPSPSTGVLQTDRTLRGNAGTLQLRCTQIAKSFADENAVPGSGTCAILAATGAYDTLKGSGKLVSVADLIAGTLNDTLTIP
jgi:hypothetical protein